MSIRTVICLLAAVAAAVSCPDIQVAYGLPSSALPDNQSLRRWNVLVIIADDLGAERVDTEFTPTLTRLKQCGVSFENAWANPTCSPTRAGILTGQHAFRHQITSALAPNDSGLPPDTQTLPKALDSEISTALIGKWHLGGGIDTDGDGVMDSGLDRPIVQGFDYFAGNMHGGLDSYKDWDKVVSSRGSAPTVGASTTHATLDTETEAYDWISDQADAGRSWVAVVSFNAPHATKNPDFGKKGHEGEPLWEWLEDDLLYPLPGATGNAGAYSPIYDAQVATMDQRMHALLERLAHRQQDALENTIIVFVGDNGTPGEVAEDPVDPDYAKGTIYEGGVLVPLVVADGYRWVHHRGRTGGWGSGMMPATGTSDALVHTVDLYNTVMELTSSSGGSGTDSFSLVPYLYDIPPLSRRLYAYTQATIGTAPTYAVRGTRFKMIVRDPGGILIDQATRDWFDPSLEIELYRLDWDRWEDPSAAYSRYDGPQWWQTYTGGKMAMERIWDR